MKIKAVCELTGLSDRTIRYYIEQQLISPLYSENYLGRRAYNFTQKDIDELNDIATLRKFDFTIEEIRNILSSPENSQNVIEDVKLRTSKIITENEDKLSVLVQLDTQKAYTICELAKELTVYSQNIPVQKENVKKSFWKIILSVLKSVIVFIIVWLPIFLMLFIFSLDLTQYAYPCFNKNLWFYILLFACIAPSVSVLVLSKLWFSWKKVAKRIALALCILSLPFCLVISGGLVTQSETTDFRNYLCFDAHCSANGSKFLRELFPQSAHYFESVKDENGHYKTVYLDAHYYYRYFTPIDYTYDVYAEWPLEKDEFYKEVNRVKELYAEASSSDDFEYATVKKGNYTCLFRYSTFGEELFTKAIDNYDYFIFAYDESNLRVRYINCCSLENGVDQPYYLELEW